MDVVRQVAVRDRVSDCAVGAVCVCRQDAVWATGRMECTSPGQVYLLLKASDLVQYDLCHVFRDVPDGGSGAAGDVAAEPGATPTLVLRRWSNLYLSNEYRCFVVDRRLVGACRRY